MSKSAVPSSPCSEEAGGPSQTGSPTRQAVSGSAQIPRSALRRKARRERKVPGPDACPANSLGFQGRTAGPGWLYFFCEGEKGLEESVIVRNVKHVTRPKATPETGPGNWTGRLRDGAGIRLRV